MRVPLYRDLRIRAGSSRYLPADPLCDKVIKHKNGEERKMIMKRRLALLLALVLSLSFLVGCGGKTPPDGSSGQDTQKPNSDQSEVPAGETFRMAWLHNAADQWHHQTALVCKQAIEEHFDNVEVTLFDSKGDAGEIQPFLERCIAEGDWNLVMYGTLSDDSDYIKQLQDMGTNVIYYAITWDFLDGVCSNFVCSEYELAYQSGMAVIDQIPENGKVLLLGGSEGYSGSILRGQGFMDALATRPDVTVLDYKYQKFDKVAAMTQMEDWITNYGADGFDALFSENDAMALGAIEAMNSAGIDAKAKVICGVDALFEGCTAVKEGLIDATCWQSSDEYAKALIERIEKLQSGELDAHCVDSETFDPLVVTQDNVDDLLARYAELGYTGT